MSNFDFLRDGFPSIFEKVKIAEERVYTEPRSAAHYTRLVLEEVVHFLYEEEQLDFPYDTSLAGLMREESFRGGVPSAFEEGLYIARKTGNAGAHYGKKVRSRDALVALRYLYGFLKWFATVYAEREPALPKGFDASLIPKVGQERRRLQE